jgi:amphi-Trp domain-containing protein
MPAQDLAMSHDEQEFSFEAIQNREAVVRCLRALLEGVERGNLTLESAGQNLQLAPSEIFELEVRSKRRGGRVKLGVRLAWREHALDAGERLDIRS